MYLYKPEYGFSVSVLYVNKEMLNIDILEDVSKIHENEEHDAEIDNAEINLTRQADEVKEEKVLDEEEVVEVVDDDSVNSRIVFDDEDYSDDEVIKMVDKRSLNEDLMCTLIFEADKD